jgi:hypothetical protein
MEFSSSDELESVFLIAIVIGSTGLVLMTLGGVYYLTRLGDIPSRKAVANIDEDEETGDGKLKETPAKVARLVNTLRLLFVVSTGGGEHSVYNPATPLLIISNSPTTGLSGEPQQSPLALSAEPPEVSGGSANDAASTDAPITEELIEIYAPAGKLGVVLDTPGDGPPTVHELRPNSVLKDELKVGDRVIAIDDEDVRRLSANKVSKIISRKMENPTRKFSIVRTIGPEDADADKDAP